MAGAGSVQKPAAGDRRIDGRRGGGAGDETPRKAPQASGWLGYLTAALISVWLLQVIAAALFPRTEIPYSEFKAKLAAGQITDVTLGTPIEGVMKSPNAKGPEPGLSRFATLPPPDRDPDLLKELEAAHVTYRAKTPPSPISGFIANWLLPLVLMTVLWQAAGRSLAGRAGGGMFGVGKSKAVQVKPEQVGVTFKDVGGAGEAIGELREIIEFLKAPGDFARLGGRIPKGVLLVGPPGTGKTLIAKATAGEAGVHFFETSGSEFVEMFVGVGAARVRDLFEQARAAAPAVVFIDEIDAIGQSRGGLTAMGRNDEREQTLNQLLAEIDGFKTGTDKPVILMAASNRPEILDPALLRAGRFDRQVVLGNPDLQGRLEILKIHSRNVKLAPDFDLERAARVTPGFSGADLANVINEAALLAARRKSDAVGFQDFEAAIERVVGGLEQHTRVMNAKERQTVATHECGHALVATLVPTGDPVSKISIIPRSRGALGYTMQMPKEDRYLLSEEELEDRIAVMVGGRAAEQLMFGRISTGASDDIQRATELARRMVTEFGMSEKLGSVRYAGQMLQYLGSPVEGGSDISAATRETIDSEVRRIVGEQLARATSLLKAHRDTLGRLADELLKAESLDGSAVHEALAAEHVTVP
ncbi:MAG TPA: ATP-dependent zinc metalloprotease FtsH [Vicinamibacteria bacterium]|nr:ATP-dependent zinc metalloprotease FtsH [Vicinamibacteria bacterium]